jgi:hypothetical protein
MAVSHAFGYFEFCYIDKCWSRKSLGERAIGRSVIACVKRLGCRI